MDALPQWTRQLRQARAEATAPAVGTGSCVARAHRRRRGHKRIRASAAPMDAPPSYKRIAAKCSKKVELHAQLPAVPCPSRGRVVVSSYNGSKRF